MRKPMYAVLAAGVAYCVLWGSGVSLAINPSPSMPPGLYVMYKARNVKVGDWVAACIPTGPAAKLYRERAYLPVGATCESGLAPVLKPIIAGPGDRVAIQPAGVVVNGVLQKNSRVLDVDAQGRALPHLPIGSELELGSGEFFLLATRIRNSLDSRYYGPVPARNIVAITIPILTE